MKENEEDKNLIINILRFASQVFREKNTEN